MELSVIIVSFNVKDYLRQCLHSVRLSAQNIEHEIIVVDNNSGDGSVEMIQNEFPDVKLILNNVNRGFSVANNQAISISGGQFILLLNPDTIVEKATFSKCIDFFNRHSDAGAIGVRMTDGDGKYLPESKRAFPSLQTAFFKISGLSFLFPRSRLFSRYYLAQLGCDEISLTEVISGAFMFLRREALVKSGFLDESFFMYGEDIDLSLRLLQTGFKNYYFPEAAITHFKGRSTSRKSYKDIAYFYKAMRIYVNKHSAQEKYRSLRFLIIFAIYLRQGLAFANRFLRMAFQK